MIKTLLIANRGEIACRIIKTAKRMGIRTVAVYSHADRKAQHVQMADDTYCLGPAPANQSYLCIDQVIAAAKATHSDAIHPGYGFLSENADFATACLKNELIFVGPSPAAIQAMGSKSQAKRIMQKAGVPIIPGYKGDDQDSATLRKAAATIGFPVLVKASGGGGGRGMRLVSHADLFDDALSSAKREALSCFNNDEVLLEKYLEKTRHVEVQIFRDQQGQGVYLFDRDCSVQRRHQKIIEEAPAPGLSMPLRKKMGECALLAANAVDYQGAGTVEFLLDEQQNFYFMEMNTRLQVEHPVTELITGFDLVEWQLKVASGDPLPAKQDDITIQGHAIEVRLCAEEPEQDFAPATGRIQSLLLPPNQMPLRIDSGVRQGDTITPFYDSMIAKVMAWGEDREQAIVHLTTALQQTAITGINTNLSLLVQILKNAAFQAVQLHTGFLNQYSELLQSQTAPPNDLLWIAACAWFNRQSSFPPCHRDPHSPWAKRDHWRIGSNPTQTCKIWYKDQAYELSLLSQSPNSLTVTHQDISVNLQHIQIDKAHLSLTVDEQLLEALVITTESALNIFWQGNNYTCLLHPPGSGEINASGAGELSAPMPGTMLEILVNIGDPVKAGDKLAIMEAMKMEHSIHAPYEGKVTDIFFQKGETLCEGDELIALEPVNP
jgi:3-methylcrotonyl-CoA carboxylase alpha subunit